MRSFARLIAIAALLRISIDIPPAFGLEPIYIPLPEESEWGIELNSSRLSFDHLFDNQGNSIPLAGPLTELNLDASLFPFLAVGGPGASLGTTTVDARIENDKLELTLGYGIANGLTIGGTLPLIRACSQIQLGLTGGSMGTNPAFNPNLPIGLANAPFLPVGFGAAAPASAADLQGILTDPTFGLEYKSLSSRCRSGLGDPTIGLVKRLHSSTRSFTSLTAALRLGWGLKTDPDDLFDPNINDASTDSYLQLDHYQRIGNNWDLRATINRTWQLPDHATLRVPTAGTALATIASKERLERNLGDYWELYSELGRQWGDWHGSAGLYYFNKAADRYRSARDQDVTPLQTDTQSIDREWHVGLRWDAYRAWLRDKSAVPLSVLAQLLGA